MLAQRARKAQQALGCQQCCNALKGSLALDKQSLASLINQWPRDPVPHCISCPPSSGWCCHPGQQKPLSQQPEQPLSPLQMAQSIKSDSKQTLPLQDHASTAHPRGTCTGALLLAGPGLPQSYCDWNSRQTISPAKFWKCLGLQALTHTVTHSRSLLMQNLTQAENLWCNPKVRNQIMINAHGNFLCDSESPTLLTSITGTELL